MPSKPDKLSFSRRISLWLSSPVRDVIRARRTGRGWNAICLPSRLMLSELPTPQLVYIDRIARGVSVRPAERKHVHHTLLDEFRSFHDRGEPPPYRLKDRRQRRKLTQRFRRERDQRHPWDRWVTRSINGFWLAILAFAVGFPLWVGTRQPNAQTDYLALINADAAAVTEENRAWPGYRDALIALQPHLDIHHHQYSNEPTQDLMSYGLQPGDPLWPQMRLFLAEHAETLAVIDRAARRPGLGFVLRSDNLYPADDARALWADNPPAPRHLQDADLELYDTLLPQIGPLRQLARLKAAQARAALEDQNADRFVELVTTLHGLAEHVSETPLMINGMTGVSIDTLKIHLVEDLFRDDRPWLTDDHLRRLAHLLDTRNVAAVCRFEGEFMMARDTLQHTYTDNGRGDGRLTRHGFVRRLIRGYPDADEKHHPLSPLVETFAACILRFTAPSRRELREVIDELEAIAHHDFAIPLWESERCRAEAYYEVMQEKFTLPLAYAFLPISGHAPRNAVHLAEAKRQAIAAVVAAERYRRLHGDWPQRLDQLVPEFLSDIPRDPADGQPVRYSLRNHRPVLYSLGADGDDDGGQWPMQVDESWRYHPQPQKPEEVSYIEDNRAASNFSYDDAVDGDWVLFPSPVDPPAELPDPDQVYGAYPFGGYGTAPHAAPDE